MRTFINHEFLLRTLNVLQARAVYADLEQLLNWDYHYWLHRGALELEAGDLSYAENFLGQSKALGAGDPFVANEWAYLLFKKACSYPGAVEAPDMVREATQILEGLIASEGYRSPYPYHVLGSQGLSWARRGIRSVDDRSTYLSWLRKVVDKGYDLHPSEQNLRQLAEDLKKEQMMLAVPGYVSE